MDHATLIFLISTAVKIIVFTFVLTLPIIAYSTYAERRVSSIIQDRVGPNRVEFWQGRPNRLHDRFQYTRCEDDWDIEQVAP